MSYSILNSTELIVAGSNKFASQSGMVFGGIKKMTDLSHGFLPGRDCVPLQAGRGVRLLGIDSPALSFPEIKVFYFLYHCCRHQQVRNTERNVIWWLSSTS